VVPGMAEGLTAEWREEREAENRGAPNLILGWDWGKWTCDLCSVDYQLYKLLDGRSRPAVSGCLVILLSLGLVLRLGSCGCKF